GDVHPRQRHALVVADLAALGDGADHVVAVDALDGQADVAVVDEDAVTGRGVLGQPLVRGRHAIVRALDVVDGDPHHLAYRPEGRAVGESAEPDLRTLEIGHDAD